MSTRTRREFLNEVGQGMLVALIGPSLAADMGLARCSAAEEPARNTPEGLERLVALLQETPPNKLMPTLVEQIGKGTTLRELTAAGALANARAFGGHDYVGYHTFMALAPAFAMSQEMPEKERALPVLKVLRRNSETMGSGPNRKADRLGHIEPAEVADIHAAGKQIREASLAHKNDEADRLFSGLLAKASLEDAYNELQPVVQDELNVHRVVLAWRSWETIDFTGKDHARTLLRQSLHLCSDKDDGAGRGANIKTVLPQLMEKYKLMEKTPGKKEADADWIEKLVNTIYGDKRELAAEAVAAALSEGFSPEVVGEAISIACARLVLGDPGRDQTNNPYKGIGSVHGDSVGVHASDAANAWRHIARVSNARNTFASLIAGAYHTAGQNGRQGKGLLPQAEDLETVKEKDAKKLLGMAEEAIRGKDQRRACAVALQYAQYRHEARPYFDLLLKYAVSEDGALHAEKYYRTVAEEFATIRQPFRWEPVIALSRVTASLYGKPGSGVEEARKLLLG